MKQEYVLEIRVECLAKKVLIIHLKDEDA